MERQEAIEKLEGLVGKDLLPLAEKFGVTVWNEAHLRFNKGWAGHVFERYLGLPINSAQAPNFGSWELKSVPLKTLKNGTIVPKETMAITMIDPVHVLANDFTHSHLLTKLRKMVVCARIDETGHGTSSRLYSVGAFNLDDREVLRQVEDDYKLVRSTIARDGFETLTGRMGGLVQPRTKGMGHGSKTRAFYARKELVKIILRMD